MEKIKLSINCPINVDIYVLAAYASMPLGFFTNVLPIVQFRKLLMAADMRKAMVLHSSMNHVPPSILSIAV